MRYFMTFAVTLLAGPAAAQENTAAPVSRPAPATMSLGGGAMQVCRADFISLCPDQRPGDGKLGQCVRDNFTKLSSGCRDALRTMRSQRRQ